VQPAHRHCPTSFSHDFQKSEKRSTFTICLVVLSRTLLLKIKKITVKMYGDVPKQLKYRPADSLYLVDGTPPDCGDRTTTQVTYRGVSSPSRSRSPDRSSLILTDATLEEKHLKEQFRCRRKGARDATILQSHSSDEHAVTSTQRWVGSGAHWSHQGSGSRSAGAVTRRSLPLSLADGWPAADANTSTMGRSYRGPAASSVRGPKIPKSSLTLTDGSSDNDAAPTAQHTRWVGTGTTWSYK
jgi:hypothetical protein